MKLTDKDIISDVLIGCKTVSDGYHIAMLESANESVRQVFKQCHDDQVNQTKQVFDAMNSRGWYKAEQAKPETLPR